MSPRSFLVTRQNQPATSSTSSVQRPFATSNPKSLLSVSSQQLKPAKGNDERVAKSTESISNTTSVDISAMAASKRRREFDPQSPSPSPPRTTTTVTRPTTPSSPVQIPLKPKTREAAHPQRQHRHHGDRRHHSSTQRPRDVHTPDAIPPSVAALLAITSIPPPKASRSLRKTSGGREKRMTVDSIIEKSQESEKKLSLTLSKGPLDLLLTPPEDLEADDISLCESNLGSALSTRTVSLESMPSLSESYTTDAFSSLGSPRTPSRRRKAQPTRRSLTPVSSPPGQVEEHPLSSPAIAVDEMDFRVFEKASESELETQKTSRLPFKPLKSAFKSNLTASLRALRQAARSLSSLNLTSIPPEDFLTRSILTLDPQVPFTDERRPPPLEEEPTAALRRYLNPTTSARLEQPLAATPNPGVKSFTASIQMQTYKVHRARSSSTGSGRAPHPPASPSSSSQASQGSHQRPITGEYPMPGPRQREMRENPDFIRIAVMEMAMRRQGKLDDQRPGRARWALPPRKTSAKTYIIGDDGIPARWIAITYD